MPELMHYAWKHTCRAPIIQKIQMIRILDLKANSFSS